MRTQHSLRSAISFMALFIAGGALLSGCEGSLGDQLMNPDTNVMAGQNGRVTNTIEAGGAIKSEINASDMTSWVYLQLATGKEVTPTDPQSSSDWDLAFLRFQIKVNGGISGKGGVEVALVNGTPYSSLVKAPASGYVTDQADSADSDTDPDYAFLQSGPWYNYNVMTHVLTAKDQVYVVRSTTGTYFKLQMTNYYDQAGSSGYPAFRWQTVTAP